MELAVREGSPEPLELLTEGVGGGGGSEGSLEHPVVAASIMAETAPQNNALNRADTRLCPLLTDEGDV